jgi:hypothetical protein
MATNVGARNIWKAKLYDNVGISNEDWYKYMFLSVQD